MRSESYHGVVKQGVVVLNDVPVIPDGTPVVVTPVASERGASHTVLAVVEDRPHVAAETVDDLERAIEAGKRPLSPLDPFVPEK